MVEAEIIASRPRFGILSVLELNERLRPSSQYTEVISSNTRANVAGDMDFQGEKDAKIINLELELAHKYNKNTRFQVNEKYIFSISLKTP
jgi:hypothetical protein